MNILPFISDYYDELSNLEVHPYQEKFVSSFDECYEKYKNNQLNVLLYGIKVENQFVGYTMLRVNKQYNNIFIWQFAIGKDHQGKGYGRVSLSKLIEKIHESFSNMDIVTSVKHNNKAMNYLCSEIGFTILENNSNEIDYKLISHN